MSWYLRSKRVVLIFFTVLAFVVLVAVFKNGESSAEPQDSLRRRFSKHVLFPPQFVRSGANLVVGEYDVPYLDTVDKLLFCWIPKNACTQIKALFCRRFANFTETQISPETADFLNTVCHYEIQKYVNQASIWSDPTWQKWALLRDPLDRFLSGWTEKCFLNILSRPISRESQRKALYYTEHCYGCKKNLTCFLEENWKYIRYMSRFGIGYPLAPEAFVSVDHFFPQFWFCGFHNHFSDYSKFIVHEKSAKFRRTFRNLLLHIGWPKELITSGWGPNGNQPFLEQMTGHTAPSNRKNFYLTQMKRSPELSVLFLKTYWVDYHLLNFEVPSWMSDNVNKVDV